MSTAVVEAHRRDLAAYDTDKGTVRFAPETGLPASLVRKLVKARIAENLAIEAARKEKHARGRRAG
jgi:uncharacterized protein YdhG (YjbR/CyaY superfamily)